MTNIGGELYIELKIGESRTDDVAKSVASAFISSGGLKPIKVALIIDDYSRVIVFLTAIISRNGFGGYINIKLTETDGYYTQYNITSNGFEVV